MNALFFCLVVIVPDFFCNVSSHQLLTSLVGVKPVPEITSLAVLYFKLLADASWKGVCF